MKRFFSNKGTLYIFICLIVLLINDPGFANIFGSPHDLFRQGYLLVDDKDLKYNPQCQQCHIPQTDERPLLWDKIPSSLTELGEYGILCSSCHDGVSMMDRNIDAGLTVFHPKNHGLNPSRAPGETDLSNTGLPYIPGDMISCLTCHDPHSQDKRPFLRVPIVGICSRCHQGRRHTGYGYDNGTGSHPVSIEPFDNTEGASPIDLQPEFSTAFPKQYPLQSGILEPEGHWRLGGHLSFGHYGRIECITCHAYHGNESTGPVENSLAMDPVNDISNEFCEGCHRGQRGDEKLEPPFPNPGGTTTGRTYHPVDDDEANGIGRIVAIADSRDLGNYSWGSVDPDSELPRLLCTTCHKAHNGMENSPALVDIDDRIRSSQGITTFCEICHQRAPVGHHAYGGDGLSLSSGQVGEMLAESEFFGRTYGEPETNKIYCSYCHRAHNAGYGRNENNFIPILVDKGSGLCEVCHNLGVSHFMGDPTLPSTYGKTDPPLKRDAWPSGNYSYYEGNGPISTTLTCLSCHDLSSGSANLDNTFRLLTPGDEDTEWVPGYEDDYLCTGCHSENPNTGGTGHTHPLMDADAYEFPNIETGHLLIDEIPATYTYGGKMNCHSCHTAHNAVERGGVFIMKVIRGLNTDPKAIQPEITFTEICHSCHPASEY